MNFRAVISKVKRNETYISEISLKIEQVTQL